MGELKMFYICLFFIAIKCVLGESIEELKQQYADIVMKCSEDFPITAADLEQLKNKHMPDNEAVKCLFACAYKKTRMMNDQGFLSVEGVNSLARLYLANDSERLKQAEEFTEACKHVNDSPVTDGDKGCDRAALIFRCSVEKAAQFDLAL